MKLGRDLHTALAPEHRAKIAEQPISIETENRPMARLLHLKESDKSVRGVWISAGFIDLVNHVAHAEAIESIEDGYFFNYVKVLGQESGEHPLRELPGASDEKYWTTAILNEQQSNFNSIVGIVVGMKLANHYLGHFDRYREDLRTYNGGAKVINLLLSSTEWDATLQHGVRNALRAGCMIEGAIPFFEALGRMKTPPPWVADFIPPGANVAAMRAQMERIQKAFLEGKLPAASERD
jgi:hypothetical protein